MAEWPSPSDAAPVEARGVLHCWIGVDGILECSMLCVPTEESCDACDVVEQIRATIEMLSPMAAARCLTPTRQRA